MINEKSIDEQWKENKEKLIKVLCVKYNQAFYTRNTDEEKLKYLIVLKISEHLNEIYNDIISNQNIYA